jgi:para-nitrobenzyl esterase
MRKFGVCLFGLLLWTATVAVAQLSQNEPAVVEVEGGTIRGLAVNGVISWKGIPYAAPPVGNLRWRVPQPVRPWQGVREAKSSGRPPCRPIRSKSPRIA